MKPTSDLFNYFYNPIWVCISRSTILSFELGKPGNEFQKASFELQKDSIDLQNASIERTQSVYQVTKTNRRH